MLRLGMKKYFLFILNCIRFYPFLSFPDGRQVYNRRQMQFGEYNTRTFLTRQGKYKAKLKPNTFAILYLPNCIWQPEV
jgi:hypothetical protein